MITIRRILVLLLCTAILSYADGNTFKVRYNGGSVPSKVKADDWGNNLTITPEAITFELKDGNKVVIPPKSVTGISYGQEAHRRVGTMVALAVLISPVALFGLFHKTRLHYIGIQYTGATGTKDGVLLQGDKGNYRAILVALQGVTNLPVSVSEKEREFVPVGVRTTITKGEEAAPANQPAPAVAKEETGSVILSSNPDAAEVSVDGSFYGNAPVTLKLKPGKHTVTVKMAG